MLIILILNFIFLLSGEGIARKRKVDIHLLEVLPRVFIAGQATNFPLPSVSRRAGETIVGVFSNIGYIDIGTQGISFVSYKAGTGTIRIDIGTITNRATITTRKINWNIIVKPNELNKIQILKEDTVLKAGESVVLDAKKTDLWDNEINCPTEWYVNNSFQATSTSFICKSNIPTDWKIETRRGNIISQSVNITWTGDPVIVEIESEKDRQYYVGDKVSFVASVYDSKGYLLKKSVDFQTDDKVRNISVIDNILYVKLIKEGTTTIIASSNGIITKKQIHINALPDPPLYTTAKIIDINYNKFVIVAEFTLFGKTIIEEVPFLAEYIDYLNDPQKVEEVKEWMKLRVLRKAREIEKATIAKNATADMLK